MRIQRLCCGVQSIGDDEALCPLFPRREGKHLVVRFRVSGPSRPFNPWPSLTTDNPYFDVPLGKLQGFPTAWIANKPINPPATSHGKKPQLSITHLLPKKLQHLP